MRKVLDCRDFRMYARPATHAAQFLPAVLPWMTLKFLTSIVYRVRCPELASSCRGNLKTNS